MDEYEKVKQRFELLKMARELLNEEYINRRAEDHNRWLAENEILWRTTRRNLPYPPFAPYPTDEEIVKSASNLYLFIYGCDAAKPESVITSSSESTLAESPVSRESIVVSDLSNIEQTDSVIEKDIKSLPSEDGSPVIMQEFDKKDTVTDNIRKLLPGWVRRSV